MADDEPPSFADSESEARYWRQTARDLQDTLDETKAALEDFQVSSKELEEELERDLASTEKRETELRGKWEVAKSEVDDWKGKYQTALREHATTLGHMQRELEGLRKSEQDYRTKLRDMELNNDDLENSERALSTTVQDLESRYEKAIERTALLEEELVSKAVLEEENQRLKDELRDSSEELAVLRDQRAALPPAPPRPMTPPGGVAPPSAGSQHILADLPHSSTPPLDDETTPRKSPSTAPLALPRDPSTNGLRHHTTPPASAPLDGSQVTRRTSAGLLQASPSRIPSPSALSPPSASAAIARSTNVRNLSSLAATPKTTSAKRGATTKDLRDMTARVQNMTARLESRRNLQTTGSGIPRLSGATSPAPHTSPTATAALARSKSRRDIPGVGTSAATAATAARAARASMSSSVNAAPTTTTRTRPLSGLVNSTNRRRGTLDSESGLNAARGLGLSHPGSPHPPPSPTLAVSPSPLPSASHNKTSRIPSIGPSTSNHGHTAHAHTLERRRSIGGGAVTPNALSMSVGAGRLPVLARKSTAPIPTTGDGAGFGVAQRAVSGGAAAGLSKSMAASHSRPGSRSSRASLSMSTTLSRPGSRATVTGSRPGSRADETVLEAAGEEEVF